MRAKIALDRLDKHRKHPRHGRMVAVAQPIFGRPEKIVERTGQARARTVRRARCIGKQTVGVRSARHRMHCMGR
jgi:hypothetical protein